MKDDATRTMGPEEVPGSTLAPVKPNRSIPAQIGRYRIVGLIGEGGMGAVYQAEQDKPRRTVALKVIKSLYASPEMLRRFEQESQALARLQHPGIAQIFEAGTAEVDSGAQPYFAMEFIANGQTLTKFCVQHGLNVRQKLELMAQVCDAVHHAHQRGIIHRDLKPGTSWWTKRGIRKFWTSASRE